jgi:hypothetical protein
MQGLAARLLKRKTGIGTPAIAVVQMKNGEVLMQQRVGNARFNASAQLRLTLTTGSVQILRLQP